MRIVALSLLLLLFSTKVLAYKVAIYTDEPNETKAREIKELINSTYPFNQFELDLVVVPVSPSRLDCKTQLGIARNIGCESEDIAIEASRRGIDQVMIVKNSTTYGGSGGSIPVITSSSPANVMLHEYMHSLGFCDEYEYSAEESVHYCKESGPNMAIIEPNPQGYSSDASARRQHRGEIPWYSLIKDQVLITHSNGSQLGTGAVDESVFAGFNTTSSALELAPNIGLYEGKTCKKASPPKKTWQPGGQATIMQFSDAGLGKGNEAMVAKILEGKGLKRKRPQEVTISESVQTSELRMSKDLSALPKSDSSVRNTAR